MKQGVINILHYTTGHRKRPCPWKLRDAIAIINMHYFILGNLVQEKMSINCDILENIWSDGHWEMQFQIQKKSGLGTSADFRQSLMRVRREICVSWHELNKTTLNSQCAAEAGEIFYASKLCENFHLEYWIIQQIHCVWERCPGRIIII